MKKTKREMGIFQKIFSPNQKYPEEAEAGPRDRSINPRLLRPRRRQKRNQRPNPEQKENHHQSPGMKVSRQRTITKQRPSTTHGKLPQRSWDCCSIRNAKTTWLAETITRAGSKICSRICSPVLNDNSDGEGRRSDWKQSGAKMSSGTRRRPREQNSARTFVGPPPTGTPNSN